MKYKLTRPFLSLSFSGFLLAAMFSGVEEFSPAAQGQVKTLELSPQQKEEVKLKSARWAQLREKAEVLGKGQDKAAACALYEQIIAERQALGLDLAAEYALLGELLTDMGRESEAEAVYKKMLVAREALNGPDDSQVVFALNEYAKCLEHFQRKPQAAKLRARVSQIEKEFQAKPVFSKIDKALDAVARRKQAEACRLKGEWLMRGDRQDKAYAYFNHALALCPGDPELLCLRAQALSWMQQFNKALADLNLALKLKSDFAGAYQDRAFVHENMQHYPLAIADFEKAIALNPQDIESMGSRAKLLDVLGRHREAVAGYTRVIETSPGQYWPYVQRAVAYNALKQYKEAIADYTVLVERAPEDTDYYEFRAGVYVKAGHLHKALEDYEKILALEPKHGYVRDRIAQVKKQIAALKTPSKTERETSSGGNF